MQVEERFAERLGGSTDVALVGKALATLEVVGCGEQQFAHASRYRAGETGCTRIASAIDVGSCIESFFGVAPKVQHVLQDRFEAVGVGVGKGLAGVEGQRA